MRIKSVIIGMIGLAVMTTSFSLSSGPAWSAKKAYRVSFTASATSVQAGQSVTLNGKVKLSKKSTRKVKVQYKALTAKSWKTLRSVKTTKSGSFSTSVKITTTFQWRICKAKGQSRMLLGSDHPTH